MSASHTPGPWVVDGGQQSWSHDKGTIETVLGGDGETVVASLSTGPGISDNAASRAQTKADARLIAAAPDGLAAAELALAWMGKDLAPADSQSLKEREDAWVEWRREKQQAAYAALAAFVAKARGA